jgi:PAS domain S-box-containing protein
VNIPDPALTEGDLARFHLAAIVQSSEDAIVSKDLDGRVQSWNKAAERIFGHEAREIVGRSITLIIPPERQHEETEILSRIRRGEVVEHFETVRRRKDGVLIDVSVTVSPVKDVQGRIIGASKIARDITRHKRIEEEREDLLRREQCARAEADAANRAKDDFLARLSHELRTPLNAIVGWAQLLGAHGDDPSMVQRGAVTILRNARHQAQLIEDLLDLSRITSGAVRLNARPVELAPVLLAALENIRPAADAQQITLDASLQPDVGPVWGDPERLPQIFANLLSNATKFTPRRGRVAVRLERAESRAVVTVSDTGIGIAADALPRIFEPFRQADSSISRAHGGLGLGLAIVRQLVTLHGGEVQAASPGEGSGATFTVTLPVMGRPSGVVPASDAAATPARCEGVRVLVVEDDADARELVEFALRRAGAVVTAVASGTTALDVVAGQRPDIIVSDLAMPGMDGFHLLERLRDQSAGDRIPALALTAHVSADMRVRVFAAGFDGYLAKPVDPDELVGLVRRHAPPRRGGAAA